MKKLTLSSLFLGAVLFAVVGTSSLSAEMKCGAGKCGAAMMKPKTATKCGGAKKDNATKCGSNKKDANKKCGNGKCGSAKKDGSGKKEMKSEKSN